MGRAYPYNRALKIELGTTRYPKWKVMDIHGNSSFSIASTSSFELKDTDGTLIDDGTCTVNNSDTDSHGNSVKTVQVTLDAAGSAIQSVGDYALIIKVVLTSGESDKHTWPVRIYTAGLD